MLESLSNLRNILGEYYSKRIVFLLPFFVIFSLLETISIGLIAPLVSVLADDSLVRDYLSPLDVFDNISTENLQIIILGVFFLVYVLKSLYSILFLYYTEKFMTGIRLKLHQAMFASYLKTDYEFHLQHNRSELKRNIDEIGVVFQSYLSPLVLLIVELMILLGVVSMLMLSEPLVSALAIITIGMLSLLIYFYVKPILNKMGVERVKEAEKINRHLYQGLGAIKEVKVLQKERYFANKFYKSMGKFLKLNLMNGVYNFVSSVLIESVFVILSVILIYVFLQFQDQQNTLPILALFAMASIRLLQSVKKINLSVNQLSYAESSLGLVATEIENMKKLNLSNSRIDAGNPNTHHFKSIELKGVGYKYLDSNEKNLKNISIKFNQNTCTAIVGQSGSGKTTLVNIFLNLLEVKEGEFLVDGAKYSDLSILKNNIGYVPQSVYITDDSIERNIAFGVDKDEIDHDRVVSCLKLSHLYDFTSTLPDGTSTILGENGARLSGGQKQRLGIARALYNNPDILVFDEMTASLDGSTEFHIMREIFNMAKMKTIVIITHKINTIKSCDKIYLLERGEVVGSGSYDELYANNHMFKVMADGYEH